MGARQLVQHRRGVRLGGRDHVGVDARGWSTTPVTRLVRWPGESLDPVEESDDPGSRSRKQKADRQHGQQQNDDLVQGVELDHSHRQNIQCGEDRNPDQACSEAESPPCSSDFLPHRGPSGDGRFRHACRGRSSGSIGPLGLNGMISGRPTRPFRKRAGEFNGRVGTAFCRWIVRSYPLKKSCDPLRIVGGPAARP
jgi:hypothetical protein